MEKIYSIDVTRLDDEHCRALEDVIASQLHNNQRLLIRVIDTDLASKTPPKCQSQSLSDWTDVYEGLSDEEIEAIDQQIKTRANFTRISS